MDLRPPTIKSSLSCWDLLWASGLKAQLVEMRWPRLGMLLLSAYLIAGGLVGLLAWMCSLTRDADAAEVDEGTVHPVMRWWARGFWIFFLNLTWTPDSALEIVLSMLVGVIGSLATLMLFGVVYEKFAGRCGEICLSKRATLRRAGDLHGRYPVLTFRYAHQRGIFLCNPEISVVALRRIPMADGSNLFYQEELKLIGKYSGLPGALFLHHLIDPSSPLYAADNAAGCSFHGVIMLYVNVSGWDAASQDHHCGNQSVGDPHTSSLAERESARRLPSPSTFALASALPSCSALAGAAQWHYLRRKIRGDAQKDKGLRRRSQPHRL